MTYPGENSNLQKITNKYVDWFENTKDALLQRDNLFDNITADPVKKLISVPKIILL